MSTEKHMFEDWRMRPVIILPPEAMSGEDIQLLRDNHLCVVVAKQPELVKFVDPIPSVSSRTEIENAAIQLSRKLMGPSTCPWSAESRATITRMFVDILVQGTQLQDGPTKQEMETRIFDQEKAEELRRLARAEAKAERDAAKTVKLTAKKP